MGELTFHMYEFNCALLSFTLTIPKELWQDIPRLSRVRYFLQRYAAEEEVFGTNLSQVMAPIVEEIREEFVKAAEAVAPPYLKTPFVDFASLSGHDEISIQWTHPTLVAVMPEGYDPEATHYQDTLLDVSPGGIQNFALQPGIFTFVEAGDSLVCIPDKKDDRKRAPEEIALEDWIYWLLMSQYAWKTAWELDRGLYILLNMVTSHLKHKRTERFRDVYAVNALINTIDLLMDTLQPRNMTSTYYSIAFLEKVNENWKTDEMSEAANRKMEALRQLIGQLDEIEQARRDLRLEMFLTFVGVFALGSLVLDFLGALSFASQIPDIAIMLLGIGIPSSFLLIAYHLLRS
jgi:hypothetical protein